MPRKSNPSGQCDGEDSPWVDLLRHLLKTGGADQRVHFGLGATAHDPGLALAIRKGAGDEFDLRMPRLAGVDQNSARLDRVGEAEERLSQRGVFGEQFEQTRDDSDRRFW